MVITMKSGFTGLETKYTSITGILKMAGSLLNQKFKAEREDGAVWTASACKIRGTLTEIGKRVPEVSKAHADRMRFVNEIR